MMLMNATLSPASMEEPVSTSSTTSPAPAHLEQVVSLRITYVREYAHGRIKVKTAF